MTNVQIIYNNASIEEIKQEIAKLENKLIKLRKQKSSTIAELATNSIEIKNHINSINDCKFIIANPAKRYIVKDEITFMGINSYSTHTIGMCKEKKE